MLYGKTYNILIGGDMKRVFVFIGLKVVELSAIVFGPYFLGMLISKWTWFYLVMEYKGEPYWLMGFVSLIMLVGTLAIIVLIALFCVGNWKWAKKISNTN